MINTTILKEILIAYKKDFAKNQWEKEKFKWRAIKWFQDTWNIEADDFAAMLELSLRKTFNLLASRNNFPKEMLLQFAAKAPEEVRKMFLNLFDEQQELVTRIDNFKEHANILLEKYNQGVTQHYQDENTISTYLWLRYPDKYYIYKFSEAKHVASELEADYRFKKGFSAENLHNAWTLYDEIREVLRTDRELVTQFHSLVSENEYTDPELRTLTIDVAFYISRYYVKKDGIKVADEWLPINYDPGFTTEDWIKLLHNAKVFTKRSLEIMKRIKDYGGEATCTQLSKKYGESINFYNAGSTALARRIAKHTGCPLMDEDIEDAKWWPILYRGRYTEKKVAGNFIWKLRKELAAALEKTDLSKIDLYAKERKSERKKQYWWLNANPKIWSYSDIVVGEVQAYTFYNENGNKRRIFQNFLAAKAGDMIIGYESSPVKQVVALARIIEVQDGEKLYFEKVESFLNPIDYAKLKEYKELENIEYFQNVQGSLFKLTEKEYDFIIELVREDNPLVQKSNELYTKRDFLSEVYMTEKRYEELVSVLRYKQNIILQGAPGVGKTFTARRLAWSIMGEKDNSRIEFVQFHQNYSYEDFIMGYKPNGEGFALRYGVFYEFCQKAANHPDKEYFFIIDEINRGNLSKIFGELLLLIEKSYRGTKSTLAYTGSSFTVPKNIYIIGMMNTADRSLAMIDYALRRRFSFGEMEPSFESEGFIQYQKSLKSDTLNRLISRIMELNQEIASDASLGKGFCIGHSYFCGREIYTDKWLQMIVNYEILPMLREYWFDEEDKYKLWESILQGVFL